MSEPRQQHSGYQFGTFQGVFLPSILTILGVIMYLRFGWVLGNAGLPQTLLIVTMATMITGLTALSISALATNMRIGGGCLEDEEDHPEEVHYTHARVAVCRICTETREQWLQAHPDIFDFRVFYKAEE